MNLPLIVQVSAEDGLLHVQCSGVTRLEDFPPLFDEIRRLADTQQLKKILIDARDFRKKVSSVQRLQVALAIVHKFLGFRVAGVISTESFDPRLLAETMARNRGANVKMCTRLPEAMNWLGLHQTPARPPAALVPESHRQEV